MYNSHFEMICIYNSKTIESSSTFDRFHFNLNKQFHDIRKAHHNNK